VHNTDRNFLLVSVLVPKREEHGVEGYIEPTRGRAVVARCTIHPQKITTRVNLQVKTLHGCAKPHLCIIQPAPQQTKETSQLISQEIVEELKQNSEITQTDLENQLR